MLQKLRQEMRDHHVDVLLVPRADRFQGEYVHPSDARLQVVTGFTGSAGLAIITQTSASLFVDGRYTLQAKDEVCPGYDLRPYTAREIIKTFEAFPAQTRIGFDGWLFTQYQIEAWQKACPHICFIAIPDIVPMLSLSHPTCTIFLHGQKYCGKTHTQKLDDLAKIMQQYQASAFIIFEPQSLSWLFNIRAQYTPCIPIVPGYGIVKIRAHGEISSTIYTNMNASEDFPDTLKKETDFLEDLSQLTGTVLYDSKQAPYVCGKAIQHGKIIPDPTVRPRVIKNQVEQEGARNAHIRDGLAVCRFLHALQTNIEAGIYPSEMEIAQQLESERQKNELFMGISFDTIAGSGAHGAIVHYKATPKTDQKLSNPSILLLDSGAQYRDGTTDITRTIAIGKPTDEQKQNFTRVLKGHIALASIIFPKGTTGAHLDVLARQYLWNAGLDYAHGTGHGVGSFLSVHEVYQSIRKDLSPVFLEAGMILSNEPGYYETGAYGIRIENLILVQEHPSFENFLCFETLTLVPIDQALIDESLLIASEIEWLNRYHEKVYQTLEAHLDAGQRTWLLAQTSEI